jgi:hypothetical protein
MVLVRRRSFRAQMDYKFVVGDETRCFFLLLHHKCGYDLRITGLLLRRSNLSWESEDRYERISFAWCELDTVYHEVIFENIFNLEQARVVNHV